MLPEPATAGSERGITVRTNLLSVRSEDSDFDCRTPNRITCWSDSAAEASRHEERQLTLRQHVRSQNRVGVLVTGAPRSNWSRHGSPLPGKRLVRECFGEDSFLRDSAASGIELWVTAYGTRRTQRT